ncbi:MAG: MBL fold metallo-hydrolase [bacterium]
MQITWCGHSCFKIQTKTNSGEVIVVTDPFGKDMGFKIPKTVADIVTVSHNHYDHNKIEEVGGEPFAINGPGEYEVKGVFVYGVASFHDNQEGKERGGNTIYIIKLLDEDITIAHLGDLGHVLSNKELEHLEKIDILLIPVGGKYTISPKEAVEVANQIDPRIIIPMHYKIVGLKIDDLDGVDVFIKEAGIKVENASKLKIFKKDLPQDETKVIVLDRV